MLEVDREILIAVLAVAAIVFAGILLLQSLSYTPPEIPSTISNSTQLVWKDVYDVRAVSKYRYEIVYIKDGNISWADALFTVNQDGGDYSVDINTYDGILQRDYTGTTYLDSSTYSCLHRLNNGYRISCSTEFADEQTQLAAFALPTALKASQLLEGGTAVSGIYKGKTVQAITLEVAFYRSEMFTTTQFDNETNTTFEVQAERLVPTGNIDLWVSENIPVPIRIERYYEDGGIAIANLKSFES